MALIRRPESSAEIKQNVLILYEGGRGVAPAEAAANMILGIIRQSCAVWYDDGKAPGPQAGNASDISLLQRVERMNLLVVLLTPELLAAERSQTHSCIVKAMDEHIPVLPLALAEGLAGPFGKRYGKMHCLRADCLLTGALAGRKELEEDLNRYLSQVLLSDETTAKLRKAFSAFVFLSYRKLDREHVQDMMRLLHADDTRRDLAVWFDDYLVPGEDFSEAIRKAMDSSSLFALMVTPRLLEGDNYVKRVEYKHALDTGKPVLPLKFSPTDQARLAQDFQRLPECPDAVTDPLAAERAVAAAVRTLDLPEPDNTPEHLFYIGLAYLLGLYAERDGSRAEKLIIQSAEGGWTDGLKKLAEMYWYGVTVPRDAEKARLWQERYITRLRARFDALETPVSIKKLQQITKREFAFSQCARELTDAFILLLRIYEELGRDIAPLCPGILSCARRINAAHSGLHPLYGRLNTIVGYERVRLPDGRLKPGKSIMGEKFVSGGVVFDGDLDQLIRTCGQVQHGKQAALQMDLERYEAMKRALDEWQGTPLAPDKQHRDPIEKSLLHRINITKLDLWKMGCIKLTRQQLQQMGINI